MKKQFLALLLLSASLGLMSCGGAEEPTANPSSENPTTIETSTTSTTSTTSATEKVLESIAVSGDFTKTYYVGADEFDPVGLKVTATYSDSSTKNVTSQAVISGFDSSVANPELVMRVSYTEGTITKETTFTITIIDEPEEEKVTVHLVAKVSGIDAYEDFHSKIFVNSTFGAEGSEWKTLALTQDATDANLWSVDIADITPDQYYNFNFYYGDTEPNWDYGKNQEHPGKDDSFNELVDSTKVVDGVFTLEQAVTFVVPDLSSVTVDIVVTPSVLATSDATEVPLSEGVYVWAWVNADNDTVKFEKGEDNLWHHESTISIDKESGKGLLKCSFTLGTADAAVWTCHGGEWENGSWSDWNDVERELTLESTTAEYTVHFKVEPEIPSEDAYELTISVTFAESATYSYVGLLAPEGAIEGECWVNNPLKWAANFAESEGVYSVKIAKDFEDDATDFYFSVEIWTDGFNGNSYVGSDTSWHAFHIQLTDKAASMSISAEKLTAGGACVAGTITASSGVTVL